MTLGRWISGIGGVLVIGLALLKLFAAE